MYIGLAPSSGHISLNFKIPFKLILRRFEVVFWCLEWECCTSWKDWWKFTQIHQYYTMALIILVGYQKFHGVLAAPPATLAPRGDGKSLDRRKNRKNTSKTRKSTGMPPPSRILHYCRSLWYNNLSLCILVKFIIGQHIPNLVINWKLSNPILNPICLYLHLIDLSLSYMFVC